MRTRRATLHHETASADAQLPSKIRAHTEDQTMKLAVVAILAAVESLPFGAASAETPSDAGDDAAGASDTELAKKLQNPIGDLYSFPFQSNTNFGYGPHGGTQEILNIQPVIPIHVTPDWNVITRTILPIVWTPDVSPAHVAPQGTAPTTFSAFLSPANPSTDGSGGSVRPCKSRPSATPRLGRTSGAAVQPRYWCT